MAILGCKTTTCNIQKLKYNIKWKVISECKQKQTQRVQSSKLSSWQAPGRPVSCGWSQEICRPFGLWGISWLTNSENKSKAFDFDKPIPVQ